MPAGMSPPDRKLLMIGGCLLIVLLTATVVLAPPEEESMSPVPSTYSAQSAGAEAAYLLLTQRHYPVRRWESSPTELSGGEASQILLILAEPTEIPSEKERKALQSFLEDGGHIMFTGSSIHSFFPDTKVSLLPPDPNWKSFSPVLPSHITAGASQIAIQPKAYWEKVAESQLVLYGEPDSQAVVKWRNGDGELLWWAGSTPLTNAGITRDDNLTFFLNSVANWSDEEPYHIIYWDEYYHGERSSLWSYVGKTSLAWGGVQLGLLAAAVLLTFSRRSGPVFVPAVESRLSPLEFVETLGGLYERAGAGSLAVSVSYSKLRTVLTRQLGVPVNTAANELAAAAAQRLGWDSSEFAELMRKSEAASLAEKVAPREALNLVQKLWQFAARLEVRSRTKTEKN